MTPRQFSCALADYQGSQLAAFERREAAQEAFDAAVEAIQNELATNPVVVLDILADVLLEADTTDAITALYVAGRHEQAGQVVIDRIETHMKLRAIRQAAANEQKARADFIAEREAAVVEALL